MILTEEEMKENLRKLSLGNLQFRLSVISETIKEAQTKGDDRWENLLPQQRRLNEIIIEKKREIRKAQGIEEPEPVVVGMQPLRLTAKRVKSEE